MIHGPSWRPVHILTLEADLSRVSKYLASWRVLGRLDQHLPGRNSWRSSRVRAHATTAPNSHYFRRQPTMADCAVR